MPEPTLRSFKTECLRYQLARADLLEQYAACVQALADEFDVELFCHQGSGYHGRFVVRDENGVYQEPGASLTIALCQLWDAAASANIYPAALFDVARPSFKPRAQDP